jgi:hypothetical protein
MGEELALRGIVVEDDPRDQELERLRRQMRQLERDRADAERAAERAREDAHRALSMLRQQLGPLYRALQAVFGELDAAGVGEVGRTSAAVETAPIGIDSRTAAVWEAWKQRLGGQCAKIIDVLLLHSEMNTTQLAIAIGTRRQNIPNLIYKLNQAGVINKNGGKFSLKSLT